MTKLFVSESLVQAALGTVQVHGGYGFMTEYEVERALRDAVGKHAVFRDERDAAEHHREVAGPLTPRTLGALQVPSGPQARGLDFTNSTPVARSA